MKSIAISIFQIFKIGPGPSSSHTIGPMTAANLFIRTAEKLPDKIIQMSNEINVHLFGSLSATGKGHGTNKAVIAGLLKFSPEKCDPDFISNIMLEDNHEYLIKLKDKNFKFSENNIIFEPKISELKYQNTLLFILTDKNGKELFSKTYFSIGGGCIICDGENEPDIPILPHRFINFEQFKGLCKKSSLPPVKIIMDNEKHITKMTDNQIDRGLDKIINVMLQAVADGLKSEGLLPGPIGLRRKASDIFRKAQKTRDNFEKNLLFLNAFTLAAAEQNAAGKIVVTAPTSGASGIIPGIIYYLMKYSKIENHIIRNGLLVASLIGSIAKNNASISGAEVGCQGEVGVAAAMAAALLASVNGGSLKIIENAAESALEHHLGMTCDPIGGYVQIPCIERNAFGAVNAYNAYLLASRGDPAKQKLSFDEVLEAMNRTGRDMSNCYKETSRGGLAICSLNC